MHNNSNDIHLMGSSLMRRKNQVGLEKNKTGWVGLEIFAIPTNQQFSVGLKKNKTSKVEKE